MGPRRRRCVVGDVDGRRGDGGRSPSGRPATWSTTGRSGGCASITSPTVASTSRGGPSASRAWPPPSSSSSRRATPAVRCTSPNASRPGRPPRRRPPARGDGVGHPDAAARARRRGCPEPHVSRDRRPIDELFAVLADPTRRDVLERLVHDGPQTATELAAHFPTDPPGRRQAPPHARRRRPRGGAARWPRGALPRHDGSAGRRRRLVARRQSGLGPAGRPLARPTLTSVAGGHRA